MTWNCVPDMSVHHVGMFSFHIGGDTKAKVTETVAGNLTIAQLEAVDRPDGAQR